MRKNIYSGFFTRLIACYAVCSFFISETQGQVYNGSLTLFTQADVDAFNYTSVIGSLTIQEISPGNITNLNGLSELTTVEFSLNIRINSAITNLDGLSNLVSVGGDLSISHNSALSNFNGLSNLSAIGSLYIDDNTALVNLNGLSKIRSLNSLTITRNPISNIEGLSNLTAVAGNVDISFNGAIKNLNGLANLNSAGYFGGTFKILNNSQLTDFCGLYTAFSNNGIHSTVTTSGNGAPINICSTLSGNLTLTSQEQVTKCNYVAITGNLVVHEAVNSNITNLGGLSNLTSLGGTLTVQNNTALSSYCGLYNLFNAGYAGSYTISGNLSNPTSLQIISGGDCPIFNGDITLETQGQVDAFHFTGVTGNLIIEETTPGAIINLNTLSQLTFVGKNLQVGHSAVTNLNVLNNLTSVGGILKFGNPSLSNIDGLSHLASVGGLEIIGLSNSSLTNINGLSHLTTISGAMLIFATTALTNLDGLSGLSSVGHIDITLNTALTNIDGLSHLQIVTGLPGGGSIGVGLLIKRNNLLTDLDGLSGLQSIEGSLEIEENNGLINIDGLHNLKTLTERISIFSNPSLQNVDGLSNLQSFLPDHALRNILIVDNDALKNLNGLKTLQFVWQNVSISGNALLENIDGLSHLNQALSMSIVANSVLTNLNGLSNVAGLNTINIGLNSLLSNFCGLYKVLTFSSPTVTIGSNLVNPTPAQIIAGGACSVIPPDFILTSQAEVDAFNYTYVPASLSIGEDVPGNITNLNNLSQLTGIAGSLFISHNSALTNVNGLTNLTNIGTDLFIDQNNSLVNLNGLSHLTSIGRDVNLFQNTSLQSIHGLAGVRGLRQLLINGNDDLTNIELSSLLSVESIVIDDNNVLPNLNGLNNLTSVKDFLGIRNNAILTNVDGLSGLTFVGGDPNSISSSFDIHNNAALTNLDGLSNLSTVEGNLLVANNTVLNKFCGLYDLLSTNGLGGTYRVFGNATNPSLQDIINGSACALSTNPVTVTINQASGQADPASVSPIHFTVTFSEDVTGFDGSDISFTNSTASGTLVAIVSGGASTYDVSVSGMTSDGTVVASIAAGKAINGSGHSNLASTSIDNMVTFIFNHCPAASPANVSVQAGATLNIQLLGTDADNDPLVYAISQQPIHGSVSVNSTGLASYTPVAGYYGTDQFKYKVSDGKCEAEATVSITIVVCPKGSGYWKNHPEAWPSSALPMLLGTRSYTKQQLLSILNMPIGNGGNADASLIIADQEIAVKLNIASGSPIATGLNDSLLSADRLIGNNALPMKVKPNSALGKRMTAVAEFLSLYNNGSLTQGCHDEAALTSSRQMNSLGEFQNLLVKELDVKVYPNPSTNNFSITVQADANEKIAMQVVDMYGRIIETRNVNSKSPIGFGDHYNAGTYFVRIIQGKNQKQFKLVKL